MSRCMCGHHANGSRPAAWCEGAMRDGDLALSGQDYTGDTTAILGANEAGIVGTPSP